MKKQLVLALMFVFTLAVFTPAIASAIDSNARVVLLDDDKKDKKVTEKACCEKKEACTKTENKACCKKAEGTTGNKACCNKSEAKTECTKKAESGCCAAKKTEKK